MLITLRTMSPQDLAAIKVWIDVHGTLEEQKVLMASLPSLPIGDAWFWSPGWPTDTGITLHMKHGIAKSDVDSPNLSVAQTAVRSFFDKWSAP